MAVTTSKVNALTTILEREAGENGRLIRPPRTCCANSIAMGAGRLLISPSRGGRDLPGLELEVCNNGIMFLSFAAGGAGGEIRAPAESDAGNRPRFQ